MFERSLEEKLKSIFDLDKVSYNLPSDEREQEVIFIEVQTARNQIKDKLQLSRVTGQIRVFAQLDKLPYGYFTKKISEADKTLTKDLFFYDIEDNAGTFMNVCERSMSFLYLFKSQYDPNQGLLNELETTVEVNE